MTSRSLRKSIVRFCITPLGVLWMFWSPKLFAAELAAAISLAQQTVQQAYSNKPFPSYLTMSRLLQSTSIYPPPSGRDWTGCRSNVKAYTTTANGKAFGTNGSYPYIIRVCQEGMRLENQALAQALIHETVHLQDDFDECSATRIEVVTVLTSSPSAKPFRNGYFEACNLELENGREWAGSL